MSGNNFSRRDLLKGMGAIAAGGAIVSLGGREIFAATSTLAPSNSPGLFVYPFRRPPVLLPVASGTDAHGKYAKYRLTQMTAQDNILPGMLTQIAGYNGLCPGPTIKVNQGTRTEVRIANHLNSLPVPGVPNHNTVTHLHGSASLPQYDGYANDETKPGYVKNYHYPNWQQARTLWYHDHNHHQTAQDVFSGILAQYHLKDKYETAQLPQGEYDVPLIVQDLSFNQDGSVAFGLDNSDDATNGFMGDTILVNGVPWPKMKVKPRVYRFRVLGAAISRSWRFALSTGDPFYVVATDAGMAPKVNAVTSWRQGVAERYEVLIDFRKYKVGQKIELKNLSNKNNINFVNTGHVMQFEVVADSGPKDTYKIPTTLDIGPQPFANRGAIDVMKLKPSMATSHVSLNLQRVGGQWTVNGDTWDDVERSGFTKTFGNFKPYEIVTFEMINESGGWFHPLHIHLIDIQIYGRSTTPDGKAFPWENSGKDVFYLGEHETVYGVGQMNLGDGNAGGYYMTHCHNLVHEDNDMMVQYFVGNDRNVNNPITSDPAVRDTQAVTVPRYATGYRVGT
jgi:FtsP/CotA-like multicopper oxidase with cupredoxin domain